MGFWKPELHTAGFLYLILLVLPYSFRRQLVAHGESVAKLLAAQEISTILLVPLGKFFQDSLSDVMVVYFCTTFVGTYLGLSFWLFSDPEVEWER